MTYQTMMCSWLHTANVIGVGGGVIKCKVPPPGDIFSCTTTLVPEQFQTDVPLSYTCTYSMYQGVYTYSDQECHVVQMSLVYPKQTPDNTCDIK
jgi:hypothetical protein